MPKFKRLSVSEAGHGSDSMKIKTSELSGIALDYAVALCEGGTGLNFDTVASWWITIAGREVTFSKGWSDSQRFRPSHEWAHGGPIIERQSICVLPPTVRRIGKERHAFAIDCWRAMVSAGEDELAIHGRGSTPLLAALRCYVASKLGDEIEIPERLK